MNKVNKTYINKSIELAEAGLPADIPIVPGLSSNKIRRLLYWLCQPEGTNYLEIGVHQGSTFIPALTDNDAQGTCIDIWDSHWALNGAQRVDFEDNLIKHLPGRDVNVIEQDMFEVDLSLIPPNVNVFFYDGPHSRKGQYQAFAYYDSVFADRFVALVDDWNNIEAKEETRRAFADLRYTVEADWQLPGTPCRDEARWWNGLYVAMVRKE
jgi:hypothetical protein